MPFSSAHLAPAGRVRRTIALPAELTTHDAVSFLITVLSIDVFWGKAYMQAPKTRIPRIVDSSGIFGVKGALFKTVFFINNAVLSKKLSEPQIVADYSDGTDKKIHQIIP
jgi:hypothetical protein